MNLEDVFQAGIIRVLETVILKAQTLERHYLKAGLLGHLLLHQTAHLDKRLDSGSK